MGGYHSEGEVVSTPRQVASPGGWRAAFANAGAGCRSSASEQAKSSCPHPEMGAPVESTPSPRAMGSVRESWLGSREFYYELLGPYTIDTCFQSMKYFISKSLLLAAATLRLTLPPSARDHNMRAQY